MQQQMTGDSDNEDNQHDLAYEQSGKNHVELEVRGATGHNPDSTFICLVKNVLCDYTCVHLR